jgi:hypothetical protein
LTIEHALRLKYLSRREDVRPRTLMKESKDGISKMANALSEEMPS